MSGSVSSRPGEILSKAWNKENPPMASRPLAGKCFCGAVQYSVADEFAYAANCHCSNCRRTTGSAFKPFAGIEREKMVLIRGRDDRMIVGDDRSNDTHYKF